MNINKNGKYLVTTSGSMYFGKPAAPLTSVVLGSILADRIANCEAAGLSVDSVVEIPWCGWVNPWTDSGDRGAAHADHVRYCSVCE